MVLYLFFSYLSISLIHSPGQVTLYWPASGIALGFLVRYGLLWNIPLGICLLLMHLFINPVPSIFIPFSIASNVIGVSLAATYIRTYQLNSYLSMRSGFILLRASILMSLTSALIGVTGLYIAGLSSYADFWPGVAKWSMGDLLGVISTGPALLLLTSSKSNNPDAPTSSDYAPLKSKILWVVLLLFSFAVIFVGGSSKSPYALGLTGIPIALLVWSSIRFQPIWSAFGISVVIIFITAMTGFGMANFKQPTDLIDVAILLSFLSLIALFPLILMASNYEIRVSTRNIIRRATTDLETGLPNRTALEETANRLFKDFGPTRTLAYLDFDHFKLVNDTTSHQAGDELIKGIASMLTANLYPRDKLFRMGGDEFALLLTCEGSEAELRSKRVLHAIESFKIGWQNHILSTTASIGLATLKPGYGNFAQLLSQADAACFTAKELGGNRVCLSEGSTTIHNQTVSMRTANLIKQALNHNYFELVCQDIMPLSGKTNEGRYFEVLLRLRDPQSGLLLSPNSFIPVAERFNLGVKMDQHVINQLLTWMENHPQQANSVAAC